MNDDVFSGKVFSAPDGRCHHLTSKILEYIGADLPTRILEIGCGTGRQIFDLASKLPDAVLEGVDISEKNIGIAHMRLADSNLQRRLSFHHADYLGFTCSPYDVIISDSTLHNINADTRELFKKLAGDLVSGGLLFFTIPYDCMFNRFLWLVRRILSYTRGDIADKAILKLAILAHGNRMNRGMLKERLPYMYLTPRFSDSHSLREYLRRYYFLECVGEWKEPQPSIGKPKHVLLIMRKTSAGYQNQHAKNIS